jgi:hypothetical protein
MQIIAATIILEMNLVVQIAETSLLAMKCVVAITMALAMIV